MFISINKVGGRYEFAVGESVSDDAGAFFRSSRDFHLVDGLPSTYGSFWEAHAWASRLVEDRPSHVQAKRAAYYRKAAEQEEILLSPEGEAVSHYSEQVSIVHERMNGIESLEGKDKEQALAKLRKELAGLAKEVGQAVQLAEEKDSRRQLQEMVSQVKGMEEKLPPESPDPKKAGKNFVVAASEKAAEAVRPSHPDACVGRVGYLPDEDRYESVISGPSGEDLVVLGFDSDFLLDSVMPSQRTAQAVPYHSLEFLDRYWEPVVRAVGHFSPRGSSSVMVPGVSPGSRHRFGAFNRKTGGLAVLAVKTPESGSWWIHEEKMRKTAASSSPREGDEVRCVARRLPSYYGRTGNVTAVRAHTDYSEVRVDFRRGLGPCWLETSDVEMVPPVA